MNRPSAYENWDRERQQHWELQRQTLELARAVRRLGILVFALVILPLLLGFCTVLGAI